MKSKLNILFAVAEASPMVKVGGLADVAGSLPPALRRLGHDVGLVMPRYNTTNLKGLQVVSSDVRLDIPFMGRQETVTVTMALLEDGIPVYLLENERYFNRPKVYGEPDDLERFLLFSLAAAEAPRHVGCKPNILHCHDWHAGATVPLLKVGRRNDPFYSNCATVFTIHNLGYQGWFDDSFAGRAGLHGYLPDPGDPLRGMCYSMLALAILHSDVVSTVSETYAREILTPEYGEKIEELLKRRMDSLFGIVNGIDYQQFNPATDSLIPAHYDVNNPDAKATNKAALQQKAGLPASPNTPLIGMIGRLASQKGLDLVTDALERALTETDIQLVLLGTGEEKYQKILEQAAAKHPGRVKMFFAFDLALAQLIYAGCDMYLMPSRYEPCGLGQLIAMRYGTIPVVRRTGGLADTVQDCNPGLTKGNGFVFEKYDANELLAAIKRAVAAFQKQDKWRKLMLRAMQADYSWEASAKKYESLYLRALEVRQEQR